MANLTIAAVPTTRRGRFGIHLHWSQAPIVAVSGRAIAPATSAQYPPPAHANIMDATTETARASMSLAETAEKRIALFRRARCITETLLKSMVDDKAMVTFSKRESP